MQENIPILESPKQIEYRFNEDRVIREIKQYIDSTYSSHYAQNKYQATEEIIDDGDGYSWCRGNVLKYAKRLRRKGTVKDWRKDILKVLHYAIILLYVHDKEYPEEKQNLTLTNTPLTQSIRNQ